MMFDDPWSKEFAAHGIGAMAWETYAEGTPEEGERLIVVVPHPNPDAPTFSPSIDCSCGGKSPGWHGFIVAGRVCGTNKVPIA